MNPFKLATDSSSLNNFSGVAEVDQLIWQIESLMGIEPETANNRPEAVRLGRSPIASTPCGARNRRGSPCKCPAMPNGRCRLHGGLSTGPRSPAGLKASQTSRRIHGRYSRRSRLIGAILRQYGVMVETLETGDLAARFAAHSRIVELEAMATYKSL